MPLGELQLTEQYANYPTTDIRHVLPRLLAEFKRGSEKSQKTVTEQSLEEKTKAGHVLPLIKSPQGAGDEIKHAWLWPRVGGWFRDDGKQLPKARQGRRRPPRLTPRYCHYRDWDIEFRLGQCTSSTQVELRLSDPLGLDRLVGRRCSWSSSRI